MSPTTPTQSIMKSKTIRRMKDYAQCFKTLPDHIGWICDSDTSAAVNRDTGGITNVGYIGSGVPYPAESALLGDILKV